MKIDIPYDLVQMSFASMVRVLPALGALGLRESTLDGSPNLERLESARRLLSRWPDGFHDFLDREGQQHLAPGRTGQGFSRDFAWVLDPLFRNKGDDQRQRAWLRDAVLEYGMTRWNQGTINPRMRQREDGLQSCRLVCRTEFARIHRLTKPVFNRLVAEGSIVIKKVDTASGAGAEFVDVEASKPPVDTIQVITAREAGRRLALPISVIENLRSWGVIETLPRRGRGPAWHADDVERFIVRMNATKCHVSGEIRDGISIAQLMRKKLRSSQQKAKLIQAVADGSIVILSRAGAAIGKFVVDRSQALSLLEDAKSRGAGATSIGSSALSQMSGLSAKLQ